MIFTMVNAVVDAASTAPSPANTTAKWTSNAASSPAITRSVAALPCLSPVLMQMTAPGPGETAITTLANRNAAHTVKDIWRNPLRDALAP